MKQHIKSFLNFIGIGAYIFPKKPSSDINNVEYLKTAVNKLPLDIAVRSNGSDKHVFNQIFVIEEYKVVVEFMLQFEKETQGWNIIDGGANVGFTTLYLQKSLPNSKVVSIEPDKDNYEMIKKNMHINNFSMNGNLVNAGLWSRNTYLTTERTFRDGEDWSITVKETENAENALKAFTITDIINQHFNGENIDLLKLDIEGAEKYIFEADAEVAQFLSKTRFVIIEIHDEMHCRENIYAQLKKNKFKYFNSGESTIGFNTRLVKY
jgi:FkbM family methyltransferase